jgi:hypothetical protein
MTALIEGIILCMVGFGLHMCDMSMCSTRIMQIKLISHKTCCEGCCILNVENAKEIKLSH